MNDVVEIGGENFELTQRSSEVIRPGDCVRVMVEDYCGLHLYYGFLLEAYSFSEEKTVIRVVYFAESCVKWIDWDGTSSKTRVFKASATDKRMFDVELLIDQLKRDVAAKETALAQAKEDFNFVQRSIINMQKESNIYELLNNG